MGVPYTSGPGAAGAAVSVRVSGRPGYRAKVTDISGSFSAAPVATVALTLTGDNSGKVFDADVGGAGIFAPPVNDPIWFMPGEGVSGQVAAPGGAVVAKLNLTVQWIRDLLGSG